MSKDGILMIRVPRRASPERIIPIKKDVQIESVRKGLAQHMQQASFEISESFAESIHAELEEKNIAPMNVEKPEDAIKAASAEVVESLTVGIAEAAGGEAGEIAGAKAGAEAAQVAVASAVEMAVIEAVTQIGMEIAGDAGVKAALAAAVAVGKEVGAKVAADMGAESGAEVVVMGVLGSVHTHFIYVGYKNNDMFFLFIHFDSLLLDE